MTHQWAQPQPASNQCRCFETVAPPASKSALTKSGVIWLQATSALGENSTLPTKTLDCLQVAAEQQKCCTVQCGLHHIRHSVGKCAALRFLLWRNSCGSFNPREHRTVVFGSRRVSQRGRTCAGKRCTTDAPRPANSFVT